MQKARRHHTKWLRPLVGARFQVLFTPLFGVLFTFPSQYWVTIGLSGVFSLAGWSRLIHAEFLVLRATQDTATLHVASHTQLSCSMAELSRTFRSRHFLRWRGPTTPGRPEPPRFGLFPGRSPLLGESLVYFLFLQVLRCFSSLRLPLHLGADNRPSACWVVPFGNLGIKGYLLLPQAYRSLSRPSSPPRAKAST